MKKVFLLLFLFLLSSINSTTKTKEASKNSKAQNLKKSINTKELSENQISYVDYIKTIYERINYYRKIHSSPKLLKNKGLEDKALELANEALSTGIVEETEKYGINYVETEVYLDDPNLIVDYMYKQKEEFKFGPMDFSEDGTMFMQLVWKTSRYVGCGMANDKEKSLYTYVCLFDPKMDEDDYATIARNVLPDKSVREKYYSYDAYINNIYIRMNYYRLQHKSMSLIRNKRLENKALELAKEALINGEVSDSSQYGINYVESEVYLDDPNLIVDYMYNKNEEFNFDTLEFSEDGTLFMQLVWKKSRNVGCGIAKDKERSLYAYVCLFDPKMDEEDREEITKNVVPVAEVSPRKGNTIYRKK